MNEQARACTKCGRPLRGYSPGIGHWCVNTKCTENIMIRIDKTFRSKPRNFQNDLKALLAAHDIDGALFVLVQNPGKSKTKGELLVTLECILDKEQEAAGVMLTILKETVEQKLPDIYGNAHKVTKN